MPHRAGPQSHSTPPHYTESARKTPLQQLCGWDVHPVGPAISYYQQRPYIHQSELSYRHQHCQGLRSIQITWHRAGKENTGLLCGTGEPADHHGANGIAQKTDLSWWTRRYLPDLSQNELGISRQDPCWRLHSPGNLDKKRSWLSDSIPLLRILRHVLRDRWHRWPTRICSQVMHLPALQNWQRTKPIRPFGRWSLPKMHASPIWRKWPNSTLVQLTGDCQGQRQCNGYELQRCINLLRGLHSFGFPGVDHTHGTGHTSTHCCSTEWTSGKPTCWSWTNSTTQPYYWFTCTFTPTTNRLQSDNHPPRGCRPRSFRLWSQALEQQPLLGRHNVHPSRPSFILPWRLLSRPSSRRLCSLPHFGTQFLQISLVNTTSLRRTLQSDEDPEKATQWA